MRYIRLWGWTIVAVIGCAGNGNGGGGQFETGLAVDRQASTLDQGEATMVCEALGGALRDGVTELVCRVQGVRDAFQEDRSEAVCDEGFDSCLDVVRSEELFDCTADVPAELAQCTATIGQIEACVNDSLPLLDQLNAQLVCSNLAQISADAEGDPDLSFVESMQPASCAALETQCTALLERLGMVSSGMTSSM